MFLPPQFIQILEMYHFYNYLELTPTHPTHDSFFFNKIRSLTKKKWT